MSSIVASTARRSLRRIGGATLTLGVLVAVVAELAVADRGLVASEIDAYTVAVAEIAESWGAIEVMGMRPAVADLRRGDGIPATAIVTQTRAWRSSFDAYRRQFDAMAVPTGMDEAHRLFLLALDRYDEAARRFGGAAARAARGQLFEVAGGIVAAEDGAQLFDEAATHLQRVRDRAGLPPHPAFPSGLRTDDGGR